VCLNLYFLCRVERNYRKSKQKIFQCFWKIKKDGNHNFYKLKNWKKKKSKKNYFYEIRAKKIHSKMDQQQNGQRHKGLQQNGPCQKDVLPWLRGCWSINTLKFSQISISFQQHFTTNKNSFFDTKTICHSANLQLDIPSDLVVLEWLPQTTT